MNAEQRKTPQREKRLSLSKVLALLLNKFIRYAVSVVMKEVLHSFCSPSLSRKDEYGIFYDPVPDDVPHYKDIIKHPMAFSDMKKKLNGGKYISPEPFQVTFALFCSLHQVMSS